MRGQSAVHEGYQVPALCICEIGLIRIGGEVLCNIVQPEELVGIERLLQACCHPGFMVELVIDCQALVKPRRDLDALFYQLMKDEVSQFVGHIAPQRVIGAASNNDKCFSQRRKRFAAHPFVGVWWERTMEIVIGLVYPEVDWLQQPATKFGTDMRYACSGLLEQELTEALSAIVPVHLQHTM